MNLSVTRAGRKGNFKSAFTVDKLRKNVDKFYYFFLPNFIYNQTRNTIRDGLEVAVEKNQDLKGK